MKQNKVLAIWRRLSRYPGGKWLFSIIVSWKTPYFRTIKPRFVRLEPGLAEVTMQKRWAVHNHIGTVHAIAVCNLAEVAAGVMSEVTTPVTHRWIPKSMTVEYLLKSETDLTAVGRIEPLPDYGEPMDVPVTVDVTDTRGKVVLRALITMWITPRNT